MDAIKLLEKDHAEVKSLLDDFEKSDDGDEKLELAQHIIRELMVHEHIEEQLFYPAYEEAANKEGEELVAEAEEEHHVVDLIIEELQAFDAEDREFEAKFKVLSENVKHHIEEEENEMFPSARRLLKGQLSALGQDMAELKENLLTQVEMLEH